MTQGQPRDLHFLLMASIIVGRCQLIAGGITASQYIKIINGAGNLG